MCQLHMNEKKVFVEILQRYPPENTFNTNDTALSASTNLHHGNERLTNRVKKKRSKA